MRDGKFSLAPMTLGLRILTYSLFCVPAFELWMASRLPYPARALVLGVFFFFVLIYASVWLYWRPTWFELGDGQLKIVWPVRSRVVDLTGLKSAEIVDAKEFRRQYGLGMRVGAGGLWGGFGLLRCRAETFSMLVSRTDRYVVVRPAEGRALMITPEDPERFVEKLRRQA